MSDVPVLWQIKVSHYNEKVRWALDFKGVPHRRRTPLPLVGTLPVAWVTTRGTTFPVLRLDGRWIGDSTRIIEALEDRYPDPPLYPSDPAQRARALELEEFFDEQLAPHVRLVLWHATTKEPAAFVRTAMPGTPRALQAALRPAAGLSAKTVRRRYGIDEQAAQASRDKVIGAMDRLEQELEGAGGDYLAGERFSIADLAAATLFTPLVLPPERQYPPDAPPVGGARELSAQLEGRPGAAWVHEMFRRHRGTSAEARRGRRRA